MVTDRALAVQHELLLFFGPVFAGFPYPIFTIGLHNLIIVVSIVLTP